MTAVDLDRIYREHAAAVVGAVVRVLGPGRMDEVEACVHDAFVHALEQWAPPSSAPANPAAWLTTVAKRRAIDRLRRGAHVDVTADFDDAVAAPEPEPDDDARTNDDLVAMLFVCAHPDLPTESQVALALRTLCGFSVDAIARAFLIDDAAVEKRLVRARATLRDARLVVGDRSERVPAVLRTLYVLYNEGYAHVDERLVKDALRLCGLVVAAHARPDVHALYALFLLQASRLEARVDGAGDLVTLEHQDRTRWDRELIRVGLDHLAKAASGEAATPYHFEAAIAACHALSASWAQTDWPRIVKLYDQLLAVAPSPVAELARAIAVGYALGPKQALRAIDRAARDEKLERTPLLAAAVGEMKSLAGDPRGARQAFARALELVSSDAERRFVEAKLAALR